MHEIIEMLTDGQKIEKYTRTDWKMNHVRIQEAYMKLLSANPSRKPTHKEIANATGLSRLTVLKHCKELSFGALTEDLKLLTEDVMLGMANAGMKGNAAAARLFMEVVFDWKPKR